LYRIESNRMLKSGAPTCACRNLAFHPIRLQHRRIAMPESYKGSMRERFIEIRCAISATVARFIRSLSPPLSSFFFDYS